MNSILNARVSTISLFLFLLLSYVYNLQSTYLRLMVVIAWVILFVILVLRFNIVTRKGPALILSLLPLLFYMISVLANSDTLLLNLSGSKVEVLTAFLTPIMILAVLKLNKFSINNDHIFKLFLVLLIIFIFDLFLRYMMEPDCFMNYSCRKEAKTVGLFATSNVTGASLALLINVALILKFKFKNIFIILFSILLITTMARSAILACLFGVFFYAFLNLKDIYIKVFVMFFSFVSLILIIIELNLLVDGSFLSKLDFIVRTISVMSNANTPQFFFGFGVGFDSIATLLNVNGWSPHLPFLKALLYFGFFGLVFYLIPLIYVMRYSNTLHLLSTYFIFSLAGAPMVSPALIASLILSQQNLVKAK